MRCTAACATPPSHATISRRWAEHRDKECTKLSGSAPGHFAARHPLVIVQIDHTFADIMLVEGTRSVVTLYVGFDRPNAATVALLLTRMVAEGVLAGEPGGRSRLATWRARPISRRPGCPTMPGAPPPGHNSLAPTPDPQSQPKVSACVTSPSEFHLAARSRKSFDARQAAWPNDAGWR